jgi:hypothetical protein
MAERQDDITPEERVRRAKTQGEDAASCRSEVDSLVARLRRHLAENHFADRLYEQLNTSRRRA